LDWLSSGNHVRRRRAPQKRLAIPHSRRLRLEPLEERRLLALVTVTNDLDMVNGDTSSIVNLVAMDGGDGISLREAIGAANADSGADTITFADALSGQTILLAGTELVLTHPVTIDATAQAGNVAINAQQWSRIFNITATTGDFTLRGLTLSGGRIANSVQAGGAIRSSTAGSLVVEQSIVSGNSGVGLNFYPQGGGIFALGAVTLTQSTVSGNIATYGGGIYARGAVTLTQSTVSGNSAVVAGQYLYPQGGGVFAGGAVTLTQSTVSGNSAPRGGGILAFGAVTLDQSTVSGNRAIDLGGGIIAFGAVTLTQSTVTDNQASNPFGGGVFQHNSASNDPFTINGSIVAGN
jgi:predicted outer membrane repeat protein